MEIASFKILSKAHLYLMVHFFFFQRAVWSLELSPSFSHLLHKYLKILLKFTFILFHVRWRHNL